MRKGLIYITLLYWLVLIFSAGAADDSKLGDKSDGSRAAPVHLIDLIDEQDQKISPNDDPLMPFSNQTTCGKCHSIEKISKGWHFNAFDENVTPGRNAQPWILVDHAAATQIPLSYRRWPGTFTPEQIGLSRWQFLLRFASHLPGGIAEDMQAEPDLQARWMESGELEISCLSCHNAHYGQNQAQYADQIGRQNLRWAATAACEFASVKGSAEKMPDMWDHISGEKPENPKLIPPTVTYRKNTFDKDNKVLLDIVRKIPNQRCYFCHSNVILDNGENQKWSTDEDVHLSAGLNCVDCHRNGLDHRIVRGYQGEGSVSPNPLAASFSCKGCHLGEDLSPVPSAGRLGAPVPEHPGIPPIHFEKLTCTACHSGPWPAQTAHKTKTSRAHGLGTHNVNKSDAALPHIQTPVFAKQPDGKVAPHNLIWPAFWGTLNAETITPIALDLVKTVTADVITQKDISSAGDWPKLSTEHITRILQLLSAEKIAQGKPVYVCGGKVHQLNDKGKLTTTEHTAAGPYLWPVAHNVRPAAQSLGVRGCQDCHSTSEGFFFGTVAVDSPIFSERDSTVKMLEFQKVSPLYTKAFAMSFVFRPFMKIVTLGSSAVLAVVLLLYSLKALVCIAKIMTGKD